MKKYLIVAICIALIAVGISSANIVSSSDPEDPFPASASYYTSKYAPVEGSYTDYGRVTFHAGTSPLTQVTNDHDYWPVVLKVGNALGGGYKNVSLGADSELTEIYAPGDYIIKYRYCEIPMKVRANEDTYIGIPVCDR